MDIYVNGVKIDIDMKLYPKRYRIQEVFLSIADENTGKDVILIDDGEIIGWRR